MDLPAHISAAMTTLPFFQLTNCSPCTVSASSQRQKPITAAAKWSLPAQRRDSAKPDKIDKVFKTLESWATQHVLPLLKPVDELRNPSDFFPDSSKPMDEFIGEVRALRARASGLPDDLFVVLVGDMITWEALPTYRALMSTLGGIQDRNVASPRPWATWVRAWTTRVNKHCNVLRRYLYLSGRVDMLVIERTVETLVRERRAKNLGYNPYLGFVYTSFQEHANLALHSNMAGLAKNGNDPLLASIYETIADDEQRHKEAHVRIVEKLLEVDPNGTMIAIGNMMRNETMIPAHLTCDDREAHVFRHFSHVARRIGACSSDDYVGILEHLIGRWGLEKLEGLDSNGRREQEFVCSLALPRIRMLQVEEDERAKKTEPRSLKHSWILNKGLK